MPTIPKPTTLTGSDARPEYEVVWNGAHQLCDADLLNPVATPRRAIAPTVLVPRRVDILHHLGPGDMTDRIEAALPTSPAQGLTMYELAQRFGVGRQTVNSALFRLRGRGRVASAPIDGASYRPGRTPHRYWRVTDADAANETIVVGAVENWLRRE